MRWGEYWWNDYIIVDHDHDHDAVINNDNYADYNDNYADYNDNYGTVEWRPGLCFGRQLQRVLRYRHVDILEHILGDHDVGHHPCRSDHRTFRPESVE